MRRVDPETIKDRLSYNIAEQRPLIVLLSGEADAEALSEVLTSCWVRLKGRSPPL